MPAVFEASEKLLKHILGILVKGLINARIVLIVLLDLLKPSEYLLEALQFVILELLHDFCKDLPHNLFHQVKPSIVYFFYFTLIVLSQGLLHLLLAQLLLQLPQETLIDLFIRFFHRLFMANLYFLQLLIHIVLFPVTAPNFTLMLTD